jgi:hypothetical protein
MAAPTNIVALWNGAAFALTWSPAAGATGYEINAKGDDADLWDGSQVAATSPATITPLGVVAGESYAVGVQSLAPAPDGADFVWAPAVLAPATPVVSSPAPGSIAVDWPDVAGATAYEWFAVTNPADPEGTQVATGLAFASGFSSTNAAYTPGTTIYVRTRVLVPSGVVAPQTYSALSGFGSLTIQARSAPLLAVLPINRAASERRGEARGRDVGGLVR